VLAEYVLGIDLGTTNSCMAIVRPTGGGDFRPEVLYNAEGLLTTPSVVALTAQGDWLVGQEAKGQAILNPKGTIFSAKRFIGRSFSEPTVVDDAQRMPYRLFTGPDESVKVELAGPGGRREVLEPEGVSAKVLKKLKADAEATLGVPIKRAVITVPAYFNPNQRTATLNAAQIAGFGPEVRLISEPTAAALAYGQGSTKEAETLLVFDLGGGTLDVTIVRRKGNHYMSRTINGDTHLGGDDFDRAVMEWLMDEFKRNTGISLEGNPEAVQRVRDAAEAAKCELSGARQDTTVNLPFLAVGPDGQPKNLTAKLTRKRLDEMTRDLVERCIYCCKKALTDAAMTTDQIDTVLLVGGQTRMPAVREAVETFFGKSPSKAVNPDQAVALGAAILGHSLLLGAEPPEDETRALVPTADGQAVVGGLMIAEVSSQPLGIRLVTEAFSEIVPKGVTLPATRTRDNYTTDRDGQTQVDIEVFQGENPVAVKNTRIGMVSLVNLPPRKAGEPFIAVTFAVRLDSTIHVKALEVHSKREVEAVMRYAGGLTGADLKRAIERERVS